VPTIEMKIFHGLLVRYNTKLCCIPTMAFPKIENSFYKKSPGLWGFNFYKNYFRLLSFACFFDAIVGMQISNVHWRTHN
jgi:hypothetical protein